MVESKEDRTERNLFCDTCQKDTFTLETIEGANQIILICKGCDRPFLIGGEKLSIDDPSGGPTGKTLVSWDWSKRVWQPF